MSVAVSGRPAWETPKHIIMIMIIIIMIIIIIICIYMYFGMFPPYTNRDSNRGYQSFIGIII